MKLISAIFNIQQLKAVQNNVPLEVYDMQSQLLYTSFSLHLMVPGRLNSPNIALTQSNSITIQQHPKVFNIDLLVPQETQFPKYCPAKVKHLASLSNCIQKCSILICWSHVRLNSTNIAQPRSNTKQSQCTIASKGVAYRSVVLM